MQTTHCGREHLITPERHQQMQVRDGKPSKIQAWDLSTFTCNSAFAPAATLLQKPVRQQRSSDMIPHGAEDQSG
jgi:hypothetical protein